MRPCKDCGHPLPNNSKECPECTALEEVREAAPVAQQVKKREDASGSQPARDEEEVDPVERQMLIGFIAALFLIPLVILVPLFGVAGLKVAIAIPFLVAGYFLVRAVSF